MQPKSLASGQLYLCQPSHAPLWQPHALVGCVQAFARLSAVYGGTYMLHKSDAAVVYDESGKAVGVSSEGETAKCKFVVGDPSYFSNKTRATSRVVRAICIMSHPIPNTDNAHSVQIILPQKQIGRHSGAARAGAACSLRCLRPSSPRHAWTAADVTITGSTTALGLRTPCRASIQCAPTICNSMQPSTCGCQLSV